MECFGTLCLLPNLKKFESVGQNPTLTLSGHLKDSKRWQESIILENIEALVLWIPNGKNLKTEFVQTLKIFSSICASSPELSNSAPEANFAKVKICNFIKNCSFFLLFYVSKLRGNTVDFKNIIITDLNNNLKS